MCIRDRNQLMRGRPGALSLHAAVTETGAEPSVREYPSDMAEARGVAQAIVELIEAGTRPENIAVLYRVNVQAAALETALGDVGVSYRFGARSASSTWPR